MIYTLDYDDSTDRIHCRVGGNPWLTAEDFLASWRCAPGNAFPREARLEPDGWSFPTRPDVVVRLRAVARRWSRTYKETAPFGQLCNRFIKDHSEELAQQIQTSTPPILMPSGRQMEGRQKLAVEFMIRNPFALLAAETGFGKSLAAISAAVQLRNQHQVRRWLVLAPLTALADPWEKELAKEGIPFETIRSQPTYDSGMPISLITPDQLLAHLRRDPALIHHLTEEFDGIIADDLEALGNCDTQLFRLLYHWRERLKSLLILNATPLLSRLQQLYWHVELLQPGMLGQWEAFRISHQLDKPREPQAGIRQQLLQSTLTGVVFVATLGSAGKEAPPLTTRTLWLPLLEGQQRIYTQIAEKMRAGIGTDDQRLRYYSELQDVVNDLGLLEPSYEPGLSSKRLALKTILPQLTSSGEKVVLYSQRRRWVYGLQRYFGLEIQGKVLAGDMKLEDRRSAIQAFKEDPNCSLMWVTDAAKRAINLPEASYLITLDHGWTAAIRQVVGRIRRRDKIGMSYWLRLVTDTPFERRKLDLVEKRCDLLDDMLYTLPDLIKSGKLSMTDLEV